jgi:antitoxin (DNA-binding transcriptional repressor) of toxin-antitoxin stability system
MKASIIDLRRRMAEVLKALDRNESVKILYRGRERALLIPVHGRHGERKPIMEHTAFGMWKDRNELRDVAAHVRRLRKGRFHAD